MAILSGERSLVMNGPVGQKITTPSMAIDPLTDNITLTMDRWASGGRLKVELVVVVDATQQFRTSGSCSAGSGSYALSYQLPVMLGQKALDYLKTAERNPDGTVDGVPLTRLGETNRVSFRAFVEFTLLSGTVNTTLRSAQTTESPAPTIDGYRNSVAFGASSSGQEGNGDGVLTVSHTAIGTNRGVFAGATAHSDGGVGTQTSITYAGNAMTEMWDVAVEPGGGGATDYGCSGYQLAGDGNIPTGAQSVISTRTTGTGAGLALDHMLQIISMTGVDDADPVGTAETSTDGTLTADVATVTVGSVGAADLVVDCIAVSNTPTIGADQTQRLTITGGGWGDISRISTQPGSAGGEMSWTFTNQRFAYGAVNFKALVATAAITGTATETISETDIVAGGKTIIATLTDDTYVPAVSSNLITHVTTVAQSSLAFTTSFTIQLPSTSALDVICLQYVHRSTTDGAIFGTGGSETSWTLKHSQLFQNSTFSGKLWWRRAEGNISNQAIAVSSLINSCAAMVNVYRGVIETGDPFLSATIVGEMNNPGDENQLGISTSVAGTMVALVVLNSPDLASATQSSIAIGPLTERGDVLNTGGTDVSISHASAIWTGTGNTSTFSWTQTNQSSGSFAYAITPLTTAPFDLARQDFIDGFDSAQAEATGWDAEVKAKADVTEIVRTSDTVVTWTIAAQAAYNITAQETITGTIPASMVMLGDPIIATPTFTIDTAGAAPDESRILFTYDLKGLAGGVFGGRRSH